MSSIVSRESPGFPEAVVTDATLQKYAIVNCVVVSHQHYGLVVQSDAGRRGFVDRIDIADTATEAAEWPAVGDNIRGVVLGLTQDGRIRLSIRRMDIDLVESLHDPTQALREWQKIETARNNDPAIIEGFLQSSNARTLLRWALKRPPQSEDHVRALVVLEVAPEDIRDDFLGSDQ